MAEILIVSANIDRPTFGPVSDVLKRKGHRVVEYCSDLVANGVDRLSVLIADNEFQFQYNGHFIDPESVGSAWLRHPSLLGYPDEDYAKKISIELEAEKLQEFFWSVIPQDRWLNSPRAIKEAQNKLAQLMVARKLGFEIPDTIVANSWEDITEELEGDIVMKMPVGKLVVANQVQSLYTTRLSVDGLERLSASSPFPGIYQKYVPKKREWRVTVVGDDMFEVAIYTDDSAKDDWRRHQLTDAVTFREEKLDPDSKEKCFKIIGELGLRYGCIDLVETPDGKIVYLETNPNGQFRWLEDSLGLQISGAIVSNLVRIAKN